ncbi:MAG TPA: DUF6265 family protein [Pyrinomonadaceae bacterium]|nr:DUF6265 family protein [Pyrinomonadaceae bacterium]
MLKPLILATILFLLFSIDGICTAAANDLSALAWMAGHWTGVQNGMEMEELWLAPKGNTMLAVHRDVVRGQTISFEFLRIEATAEGITYWASPKGRPATPFRMIEQKSRRVVFENPSHDFPSRIIYWLSEDASLHARIEGTQGGNPASAEWTWRRTAAKH